LNSALLNGTGSVGFATTGSLLTVSSSQQQISASQQQLSSSFLILTASFNAVSASQQQISSSYIALSASYNTFSGSASTRITVDSASLLQVSSSQQQISSSLLNVISVFATTGSNSFRATQSITGSLTVTGQIIAQTLNVQQVTSSIIYSSGSNNFGCDLNSRQTFTGSVLITGSLTIAGASSAASYSGTTIYGSTAVCSPVGKFSTCLDLGGALTGTSATFSGAISVTIGGAGITLTGVVGNNLYYVVDQTPNSGKRWRFGHTGAIGGFSSFDIYNQTDNITALSIASTGAATFSSSVTAVGLSSTTSAAGNLNSLIRNSVTSASGTTGYGLAIESEASAATSYALTVRNLAGSTTYFLISTETGKIGYVGIGTTSPVSALTIYNNSSGLRFQNVTTGTANTDGADLFLDGNDFYMRNIESGFLGFATANAERMRITCGGNVGIGTTSPTGRLMLYQSSAGNVFQNIVSNQGGSTQVGINFSPSMTDGEIAANPAQASIYATDSNFGANIIFANKTTGAVGNSLTERMRITSGGAVTTQCQPFVMGGLDGNQCIPVTTFTTLNFSTTTGGFFYANVGNSWNNTTRAFTAPVTGVYIVHLSLYTDVVGQVAMFVNGTRKHSIPSSTLPSTWGGSSIIPLTSGDALTLQGYAVSSGTVTQNQYHTWFGIYLLG
jgi:hypothetical protein